MDGSGHRSQFALLREGVLWFLGLVVAGGVEGEFGGGRFDDADVVVVDEHSESVVFVGSSDADVMQP
jgi:hypothetical protein